MNKSSPAYFMRKNSNGEKYALIILSIAIEN